MRPDTADRRTRALLLATVVALVVAGCGGGSDKAGGEDKPKPIILTLANGNGDNHSLEPFAAAVERLSGGSLRVQFKNAWRAGEPDYETGVIGDVRAGAADLGWAGSRAFADVEVASFDALHAPLLIDSYPLQRKVLESPLAGAMLEGLEPLGLVGLGILPGPMRKPLGVSRLVRPDDYAGATVAFQRSQVAEQTLGALGARGAEIPSAGAIDAYDGVEQQVGSIAGNEYDKVAGHLAANVNLWPRPVVLFSNAQAFARLDGRQRSALREAARAALPASNDLEQADDAEGAAVLCRRGVKFELAGDADLAGLRRAVQPVYDRLERHAPTQAAIAQILAIRSASPSPPDAAACSGSASQPVASATATPIDGRYRFTTTARDLRAAGEPPDSIVPENYGDWEYVLARGRYRYTQRNGAAWERASGTYTVTGDRVTFMVGRATGFYPTGASAKPGEQFTFRWSLYRDRLTLAAARGEISPLGSRLKPWRRVGDAPPAGKRTPVDGVYVLATTRKESAEAFGEASGFSAEDGMLSENYGRWRFVFSRGQLRYTQASEGNSRWTRATYNVDDDTLTMTVTDYGGEAPNGAAEKTGELFTFRWSLFRDRLTLAPVEGELSPAMWLVRPLRRVGDAP